MVCPLPCQWPEGKRTILHNLWTSSGNGIWNRRLWPSHSIWNSWTTLKWYASRYFGWSLRHFELTAQLLTYLRFAKPFWCYFSLMSALAKMGCGNHSLSHYHYGPAVVMLFVFHVRAILPCAISTVPAVNQMTPSNPMLLVVTVVFHQTAFFIFSRTEYSVQKITEYLAKTKYLPEYLIFCKIPNIWLKCRIFWSFSE